MMVEIVESEDNMEQGVETLCNLLRFFYKSIPKPQMQKCNSTWKDSKDWDSLIPWPNWEY